MSTEGPKWAYTVVVLDEFGTRLGDPMGPVIVEILVSGALYLRDPDGKLHKAYSRWGSLDVVSATALETKTPITSLSPYPR